MNAINFDMHPEHKNDWNGLKQALLAENDSHALDLEKIESLAERNGEDPVKLLMQSGILSAAQISQAWAQISGLEIVDLETLNLDEIDTSSFNQQFLRQNNIVPVSETDEQITFAVFRPLDTYLNQALSLTTEKKIILVLSTPEQISNAFERLFTTNSSVDDISSEILDRDGDETEDIERLKDMASEAPVVRLVNLLISKALEVRASDIHIEPFRHTLKVRYRIDGVLQEVDSPPAKSTSAVISRVKIMAKLNIAERRKPQDGRIQMKIQGKEIDLRVSTVPSLHGESVVMRLLDKGETSLDLKKLGFDQELFEEFNQAIHLPHGIIVVTGPTGSGKTTSLYAALQILNSPEKKIITVEDPVEYQLDGITQIQVRNQVDLTFANALRSVVRQDPDIVMIGEMRDLETASIAVQAALTGHAVFSTLHTNDSGSALTRLLDMGVQDYLLTSTINGIVAQRLVRTLCQDCCKPYKPLEGLVSQLQLEKLGYQQGEVLYEAVGCPSCGNSGFTGRTIILEFLPMSDQIRQKVLAKADGTTIQKTAIESGMQTMRDHGLKKVIRGETTLDEILRVTHVV